MPDRKIIEIGQCVTMIITAEKLTFELRAAGDKAIAFMKGYAQRDIWYFLTLDLWDGYDYEFTADDTMIGHKDNLTWVPDEEKYLVDGTVYVGSHDRIITALVDHGLVYEAKKHERPAWY